MKIRLVLSLMLSTSFLAAVAAEDKPEDVAKAKANEVAQATIKGDWGKVLDLTYPEVVKQGGGRAKLLDTMRTAMKTMQSKGYAIRSAKVGDTAQIVAVGDQRFAVVPLSLEMKVPGGALAVSSFLLGISPDKGKTWTFINGDKAGDAAIKKLLPPLPAALKLPKPEKPVFTPDK